MFKKLKTLKKDHQLMYSLLIAIALIGIWRGIWMLLDLYLLPENAAASAVISIIAGVLILGITHHKLS